MGDPISDLGQNAKRKLEEANRAFGGQGDAPVPQEAQGGPADKTTLYQFNRAMREMKAWLDSDENKRYPRISIAGTSSDTNDHISQGGWFMRSKVTQVPVRESPLPSYADGDGQRVSFLKVTYADKNTGEATKSVQLEGTQEFDRWGRVEFKVTGIRECSDPQSPGKLFALAKDQQFTLSGLVGSHPATSANNIDNAVKTCEEYRDKDNRRSAAPEHQGGAGEVSQLAHQVPVQATPNLRGGTPGAGRGGHG